VVGKEDVVVTDDVCAIVEKDAATSWTMFRGRTSSEVELAAFW